MIICLLSQGTKVAVKRLDQSEAMAVAAGTTTHQQFETEIQSLGKCVHVRLVPLMGYALEPGYPPCIVYAFMAGGSLADRLERRATEFLFAERLLVALEVGEGLGYLHCEANIIHRDIKTANILLDEHGAAKIGDFGLARHNPLSKDSKNPTHTKTHHINGTNGYMSNEYLRDGTVSEKMDVYAYGVCLLELWTRLPAYDSTRNQSLVARVEDGIQ